MHKIPTIEREFGDFLRGDDLPQARVRTLDGDFGRADFHVSAHRRRYEFEVEFAVLVDLQADVFCFGGFESGRFDMNGEIGDAEQRDEIASAVVG